MVLTTVTFAETVEQCPPSPRPPTQLCALDPQQLQDTPHWIRRDPKRGKLPPVANGVALSEDVVGCCIKEGCVCRSDVIFYNGQAYDQKPFIQGNLRTRPGNVMYLEGKLPLFPPGKSPDRYGPFRRRGMPPKCQCYNETPQGKPLHPCCTAGKWADPANPDLTGYDYAYSGYGLPYGETLGFFRLKETKICDCRETPIICQSECCNCEPAEVNPANYMMGFPK